MDKNIFIASLAALQFARVASLPDDQFTDILEKAGDTFHWIEDAEPLVKAKDDLHYLNGIEVLAAFTRANPLAPAEALFRTAQGQGLVNEPADAWLDLRAARRVSFRVFHDTLQLLDQQLEEARAIELTKNPLNVVDQPVLASALDADPRDTIFEQHPDPLETMPDRVLKEIPNVSDVQASGEEGERSTDASTTEESVGTASDERDSGSAEGENGSQTKEAVAVADTVDPAVLGMETRRSPKRILVPVPIAPMKSPARPRQSRPKPRPIR